jgi:NAD(P)-dependent dehydrogenase (short-subunit alcohol dehydrogenase family)
LGLLFAGEILRQREKAWVVLTGRHALTANKHASIEGLGARPGRVSYRQVDLGNLVQVKSLVRQVQEEYGQLNGIVHSAGEIADAFILKKRQDEFGRVLGPKVEGTYNLDEASAEVGLDFFVLFSSVAGAMGNVGQGDSWTSLRDIGTSG